MFITDIFIFLNLRTLTSYCTLMEQARCAVHLSRCSLELCLSVRQTDATPRHGGPSLAVRCTKCLQPDGAINR